MVVEKYVNGKCLLHTVHKLDTLVGSNDLVYSKVVLFKLLIALFDRKILNNLISEYAYF